MYNDSRLKVETEVVKNGDTRTCECPYCKRPAVLQYCGKAVCDYHWDQHCKGKYDLKARLKIRKSKEPVPDLSFGWAWAEAVK